MSISINEDKSSSSININSGSNMSTLGSCDNTNLESINRRKNDSNGDKLNYQLSYICYKMIMMVLMNG